MVSVSLYSPSHPYYYTTAFRHVSGMNRVMLHSLVQRSSLPEFERSKHESRLRIVLANISPQRHYWTSKITNDTGFHDSETIREYKSSFLRSLSDHPIKSESMCA